MSVLVCEKPMATDASPRCGDLAQLVRTLREEVGQLRRQVATLRAEAGYWKSRHAAAVNRNEQLQAELHQARGEIRQLKDKLFGRKSERRLAGQDLAKLVEDEGPSPPRKRGGQPRHRGHGAGARIRGRSPARPGEPGRLLLGPVPGSGGARGSRGQEVLLDTRAPLP